jgi:hypothetical protein
MLVLQASVLLLDVRTNAVVEDVPFQTSMVQNMSVSTYREKVFILVSTLTGSIWLISLTSID